MIATEIEIGAEGRLGIQQTISNFIIEEHPEAIARTIRMLHMELGQHIIDHIISRKNPVVVRLNQSIEDNYYDCFGKVIRIIADFRDVDTMKIVEYELPPFDFVSRATRFMVIEWQCAYCGMINLVVEHLECRKCGAPRRIMR